jgi:hypothetical protein
MTRRDPLASMATARRELESALEGLELRSSSDGRGRRILEEWELEAERAREELDVEELALDL